MDLSASPNPVSAGQNTQLTASNGVTPYTYHPPSSNPYGVDVDLQNGDCHIPHSVPNGTKIYPYADDSDTPPDSASVEVTVNNP